MSILQGDIKLKKTQVMQDVPEGGGAPTSVTIPDGGNNTIMPDVSEVDRAGGRFNLRKVAVHVDTNNVDEYLGANIVVSRPPEDPNVSVALVKTTDLFDVRSDAVGRVEAYLVSGSPWSGFLLQDHYAGQRNIQIFQRVGAAMPNIGRTLVLTYLPGQPGERQQYVRILRREGETRTFSYATSGGAAADYQAQVVSCEISDALRYDFPGSDPSPFFTQNAAKTVLRDTSVADAGSYFGVQPLALAASIGDVGVKAASVYTQLVPNSRTERTELDVRPASVRNVVLQQSPRVVSIASSPHTRRLKIGQENRSFSYVDILRPIPAPGTLDVSFMALGEWYSLQDDGNGKLTGAGVGTINYTTGSISITLQALPDASSAIVYTWGEKLGYTNRAGQAGFRAPEHAFQIEHAGIVPGSVTFTWTSGGQVRTATANINGVISGDATGEINYATSLVLLRPNYMVDPGGQIQIACQYSSMRTENFTGVTPDLAGFASLTLAEVPAPGSVAVRWATSRTVSTTGGGESATSSEKGNKSKVVATVGTPPVVGDPNPPSGGLPGTTQPAKYVRVPMEGSYPTYYMAPGGKFEGTDVYIAIMPTVGGPGQGYEYVLPDVTGVTWTVEEYNAGQKNILGLSYKRWGFQSDFYLPTTNAPTP